MLIEKLENKNALSYEEWVYLISHYEDVSFEGLSQKAQKVQRRQFGNSVYIRGLIEISNYCKNNCYYCGIRAGNKNVNRYRLTKEEILECCRNGYPLGFRTFVLQGGEDPYFTDEILVPIVYSIKNEFPDCAVTLSLGERSTQSYKALFDAGANRYLLRHETADNAHYSKLHPQTMSAENRKKCLYALKEIGYQVGCGFMVGSPFQTNEQLVQDMLFLQEFQPEMVGIGPFLPHCDTPFGQYEAGNIELTLFLLALTRLLLPNALIPSTTALASAKHSARQQGILAGANVVMPNLSPFQFRKDYEHYNNKLFSGSESAQELEKLKKQMEEIGYSITVSRGDYVNNSKKVV